MSGVEQLLLPPLLGARGTVRLPGSKSISNRSLLLAALAEGVTEIRDLLASDDTARMLEALLALGVRIEELDTPGAWRVHGTGGQLPVREADLFLGNAGTAFRPLTAALALAGGHYRLSGVPRMHERPIGDLVDGLRGVGADIRYLGNEGFPPLDIRPATIRAGEVVRVRGEVSSQFLTALLMALPLTGHETTVEVVGELISRPYIAITLDLMRRFGVEVRHTDWTRFVVPGGVRYRTPGVLHVEGDASSASYFLAAGAIGGGPVRVEGVGRDSIQGDVRLADALASLGARISMGAHWIEARAPADGQLRAFDLDLNHIPDAAMTLAVLALFTDGPCHLRNIGSWRVKETDRIHAMATELRKLGATVTTGDDSLSVTPLGTLHPAAIDTYDDHRIAMCFSLATLAGTRLTINDPACVNKTFPEYFQEFARVARPVPVIAIDGPSASGKGTVAARVAEHFGFAFLDSGALYRLVACQALRLGVAMDDEARLAEIAASLPVRFAGDRVWLGDDDVSIEIRSKACSQAASQVAALPAVRAALLDCQRDFRAAPGLVADGRDMGSVVFPDATLKVFLTASTEARALRRYKQMRARGLEVDLAELQQEIETRDARDAGRAAAPLQQLPDAQWLDTTGLDIDTAVAQVCAWFAAMQQDGRV